MRAPIRVSRVCRALVALALLSVLAPAAYAERDARADRAAQLARTLAARMSTQADIVRLQQAIDSGQLPAGVSVAGHTLVFVDGPEVPIEAIEWADAVRARVMRRPTTTDTMLRVGPGVTLMLANLAGDIEVTAWDRNEVRVQAEHDRADRVVAELANGTLKLGVSSREAGPAEVEWRLTVPVWLPLELSGMEGDISVTGMRSSLHAQSMRGDVTVRSCQGPLQANSVEGEVHVSDVSGNVTAGSVNNVVRIVRVIGPVDAQSINGDIQLEKLASPNVDASTVNGRVFYASPFQRRGRYAFASHSGQVYVGVPTDQHVNVTVSSFNGQVESTVPMPVPAPKPKVKGRSVRFMLGDLQGLAELRELPAVPEAPRAPRAPRAARAGLAEARALEALGVPELELESFGGLIQLASQEEVLRAIDQQRAVLDSARAKLMRARRDDQRARRAYERRVAPPAPPSPADPPSPEHR
ncbi:MAG: hypothetical protein ABL977_00445 [Candidatus Eisenbacteria bacterium]